MSMHKYADFLHSQSIDHVPLFWDYSLEVQTFSPYMSSVFANTEMYLETAFNQLKG